MSNRPKVNAISFLINKCLWMNLNSIRGTFSVAMIGAIVYQKTEKKIKSATNFL